MARVAVRPGRARIQNLLHGVEVVIPARRRISLLLFLPIWLSGWFVGETTVISQLLTHGPGNLFLVVWICAWTAGGAMAITSFLWNLCGKEVISIGNGFLAHRRAIGPAGVSREYDLANVRRLRLSPSYSEWQRRSLLPTSGLIAFDYGGITVRMGMELEEAEAAIIIDSLLGEIQKEETGTL